MSGGGFHVHGPHDHEVEHAAQHGGADSFAGKIAVTTAILSTVGALFGYQGGATQNNAMMYKNEAAIKKTEASNRWAQYQSKSNKQNLAELSVVVTSGETSEKYKEEVARYKKEKEEIRKEAEAMDKESAAFDAKSEQEVHLHHRWAQAMTAVQIAISLAAITLLTRKKWMQGLAYGMAAIGLVLAIMAALHV